MAKAVLLSLAVNLHLSFWLSYQFKAHKEIRPFYASSSSPCCCRVMKVVQHPHRGVFCSAESVVLVPITLAEGDKSLPFPIQI